MFWSRTSYFRPFSFVSAQLGEQTLMVAANLSGAGVRRV